LKTYVAQYRKDGRSHRVVIGKHGRLTPDEARKEAKALLGDVEKGADPAFERRTKREAPTLDKVAEGFLTHTFAKKKTGTARGYDNALRLHILPQLGTKRLTKITHADVESLHASMSDRRPQANRTLAVLSAVWSWAARHRHVDAASNPTKGVEKYRESARERYLTKDELVRLSDALTAAETTGLPYSVDESNPKAKHAPKPENRRRKFDRHSVTAIRLLTLTGARLREILDAKWEQVDLERGIVFLPDSKPEESRSTFLLRPQRSCPPCPKLTAIPTSYPAKKQDSLARTLRGLGTQYARWQALMESGSMICATASTLSASGRLWDSRLSGSYSAIRSRPQHSAARILTLIRCGARSKRSAQRSRRRWQANGNKGQLIMCAPHSDSVNLGSNPGPPAKSRFSPILALSPTQRGQRPSWFPQVYQKVDGKCDDFAIVPSAVR
jgi:integrase